MGIGCKTIPNSTTDQKVDWLIIHKKLWEGFPQSWVNMTGGGFYSRLENIALKMRDDRLYSPCSNLGDIAGACFKNIQRARRKIRTGYWRKN